MAQNFSFDVTTGVDLQEVDNAVNQAQKEITQRYDFKGSPAKIELQRAENKILLEAEGDYKIAAVLDVLQSKLIKRSVPVKNLTYGVVTSAAGSSVKQEITLTSGIPIEKARDVVKKIKDSKLKLQASIQGDLVRISGKDRDTLQQAIALLKGADFGIDLQFTNFRTN